MGWPNDELIPAAILLDNPRITREEFVRRLNATHCSRTWECKPKLPWSCYGGDKFEEDFCHRGLYGLAGILHLEYTPKFRKANPWGVDKNGLPLQPADLKVVPVKRKGRWVPPKFEVQVNEQNEVEKEIECDELYADEEPKVGEITDLWWAMEQPARIEKILEIRPYVPEDKFDDSPNHSKLVYRARITPFWHVTQTKHFNSQKELTKAFPFFALDEMIDFSQKEGVLYPSGGFFGLDSGVFKWKQIDGKYSLDKKHMFSRISEGVPHGYTSLVLTAEAIRNKAWNFLCYAGFRHLQSFLRDFPEARKRYEQTVFDIWTSKEAAARSLIVSEFLRRRADSGWQAGREPYEGYFRELADEEERSARPSLPVTTSENDKIPF
jgi:hypothetical protein